MNSLKSLRNRALDNAEVKAEYKALESEFKHIATMLPRGNDYLTHRKAILGTDLTPICVPTEDHGNKL